MRLKLHCTNIRDLEPRATRFEVADTEIPALRLRVSPTGIKTFILLYRNAENRQRRYTIGKFRAELTPELARDVAKKRLVEVECGKDPASEKKETRQIAKQRRAQTGSEFVFPARDGGRLDNINKAWQGVLEFAEITSFRFHDLRHHFASKLVMAGVDLNIVKELLRHSTIAMTERYSHLSPRHKAEAVAKLVGGKP